MAILASYQYKNLVNQAISFDTPVFQFDDLLLVKRNGIGIPFMNASSLSETVEVDVLSFTNIIEYNFFLPTFGKYIQILFNVVPPGNPYRQQFFEIGPAITVGDRYVFSTAGVTVSYEVQIGDTVTDIKDGIVALMNGETYPFALAAASTGADSFLVQLDDYTYQFSTLVVEPGKYLFQTGYYCELDVLGVTKEYLLYYDEASMDYPALPAVSASYDYFSITLMPTGIGNHLLSLNYTQVGPYAETSAGTTDITSVPSTATIPSFSVAYDETIFKIIVPPSMAMNVGEIWSLIYR